VLDRAAKTCASAYLRAARRLRFVARMKRHTVKLTVQRATVRTLDLTAARGGLPPGSLTCDRPSDDGGCNSDDEGSHAPTCGDGSRCGTWQGWC
jgi:hypothetical protein